MKVKRWWAIKDEACVRHFLKPEPGMEKYYNDLVRLVVELGCCILDVKYLEVYIRQEKLKELRIPALTQSKGEGVIL